MISRKLSIVVAAGVAWLLGLGAFAVSASDGENMEPSRRSLQTQTISNVSYGLNGEEAGGSSGDTSKQALLFEGLPDPIKLSILRYLDLISLWSAGIVSREMCGLANEVMKGAEAKWDIFTHAPHGPKDVEVGILRWYVRACAYGYSEDLVVRTARKIFFKGYTFGEGIASVFHFGSSVEDEIFLLFDKFGEKGKTRLKKHLIELLRGDIEPVDSLIAKLSRTPPNKRTNLMKPYLPLPIHWEHREPSLAIQETFKLAWKPSPEPELPPLEFEFMPYHSPVTQSMINAIFSQVFEGDTE